MDLLHNVRLALRHASALHAPKDIVDALASASSILGQAGEVPPKLLPVAERRAREALASWHAWCDGDDDAN